MDFQVERPRKPALDLGPIDGKPLFLLVGRVRETLSEARLAEAEDAFTQRALGARGFDDLLRIALDHVEVPRFWAAVDPLRQGGLDEAVLEWDPARLTAAQFKAATPERRPTVHLERGRAERDARGRILASRVARAIAEGGEAFVAEARSEALDRARRVQLLDEEGEVVFAAEIRR